MTKATNYLVTVTDTKETLTVSSGQTAPANSDRITISEDSGGFSFGTVGVTPTFCLADNSPILTNPDGKCPVYQDLIPRIKFNGFSQPDIISATAPPSANPTIIACTRSEFSYWIPLSGSTGSTTGITTFTATVTTNVTLLGSTVRWVTYGGSLAVAGVDYNVIAYAGNPAPYAANYVEIQLLKPISTLASTIYGIAFNAQYNVYAGTFSLSQTIAGTDGCYGSFSGSAPNSFNCVFATTTTTTTLVYRNVTIDPQNSLVGSSYTVYINGVADTTWKSGTRSYVTGTIIRIDYASPACGVVLNGVAYSSGTNTTLSVGTGYYTFTLYNANHWTDTGYQCIGNLYYSNQVNDCGGTRQVQTYPGSTCDCICNQDCNGRYYGPSVCGGAVGLGNSLIQYEYYYCNNNPTGGYQVVENCSCSCNIGCNGTYNGTPYCVGNEQRQDYYFNCNGAYAGTNVLSACSCSCNVGCSGTYWEYYCVNYGVAPYTQRRRQRYYCNNALTGVDEFVTDCSGSCGVNTSANWNNTGSPYCSGCNEYQDQIQINQCCTTPPYGSTRTVDLGVNSNCGYWNLEYYCVGYNKWSRERNTCTNATRNDTLVETNSPYCGYSDCSTWNVYAYNSDEYVYISWTNCAGVTDYTSFYSYGGGYVGSVCVKNGYSVNVYSGNGAASNTGSMCS